MDWEVMDLTDKSKLSLIKRRVRSSSSSSSSQPSSSSLSSSSSTQIEENEISTLPVERERRSDSIGNDSKVPSNETRRAMDSIRQICGQDTTSSNIKRSKIPIPSPSPQQTTSEQLQVQNSNSTMMKKQPEMSDSREPTITTSMGSTRATKLAIKWTCRECQNNCIPVRSESRCLW